MSTAGTMSVVVEDFTGQVRRRARGVPRDASVADFLAGIMGEMGLPASDSEGRSLSYGARARGGSLAESDRIGDVLAEGEVVTLTPNLTAG